jgi:transcription elongation GreA/GreB family factor
MKGRSPLRLLQQLLVATRFDEFTPYRNRLLHLHEPGGPYPHLLSKLDADQAALAEEAIERAPLEEYLRDSLLNALRMKFVNLAKSSDQGMYALPKSIAKRHAELKEILNKEIPTNRRAIEEAREMGDLRENFEYKSARQRHEYLTARAESLQSSLNRAQPIDLANIDTDSVRVGVTMKLVDSEGSEDKLSLLGPWESDPDRKIISYESDLGKSLLSAQKGDEIEVSGGRYRIESIHPYSDE